ncbi:MAG TPA: ribonuclease P protein component [Candidatus Paceibacterota bacterium]|nr:ribonuclease P protein component [Candidatus Paceibacterota bacterium]
MIPRRLRLSRAQFAHRTNGKRAESAHFSVTYRAAPGQGGCSSVISKKVAKRAVDRHLLKRRMNTVLLPWCSPTRSIVVYARAGSLALTFRALNEELTGLLRRTIGR